MARIAFSGSGRDWTWVKTRSAGRERVGGHRRVAGAERRKRIGIDAGIVGEVAAASRDDLRRAGKTAPPGQTLGDAVVDRPSRRR